MFDIYTPRIKQKGFNPSPYAGNIPYYADSQSNPKCFGSPEHYAFWEEALYYCINGYDTGGLHIPGEYFEYLNFKIIDGPRGAQYPDFIDLHYDLYQISEDIKKNPQGLGLLVPKARRKGLSFWGEQKLSYGARFTERYRAAVAGGLQTFVDGFRSKLYRTYNEVPPELRMNHLIRNNESLILGYDEKTQTGDQRRETAVVLFKTMKDSGSKLEGEYFNDVILEELGEFELAEQAIISITPALMDGDDYIGKIWGFGTGGNMKKGGATFQQIVSKAGSLSFEVVFIPGRRMYFPYVIRNNAKIIAPNIYAQNPDLSHEQLLGCEDVKAAANAIEAKAKKLAETGDRTNLIQHKQNFPEDINDVFVSPGSNSFNVEKCFLQKFAIDANPKKYGEYVLEFKKDKNGKIEIPYKVFARLPKKADPEWKLVKILHGHMPIEGSRNLDIVGVDGYNLDQSKTSKSLGGIVVLRRNDTLLNKDSVIYNGKPPILIYYKRPPRKEFFWEISLKVSIFYNALKNTMGGIDADSLIGYYKDMGCKKFLSPRPKSFESDKSEQIHEFWYKNTPYSVPRVLGVMQTWIEDSIEVCWFEEIPKDFIAYDEVNIGTDYDLADAIGHALIRIQDMQVKPVIEDSTVKKNSLAQPTWKEDSEGNIIIKDNPFDKPKETLSTRKEDTGGWRPM